MIICLGILVFLPRANYQKEKWRWWQRWGKSLIYRRGDKLLFDFRSCQRLLTCFFPGFWLTSLLIITNSAYSSKIKEKLKSIQIGIGTSCICLVKAAINGGQGYARTRGPAELQPMKMKQESQWRSFEASALEPGLYFLSKTQHDQPNCVYFSTFSWATHLACSILCHTSVYHASFTEYFSFRNSSPQRAISEYVE